MPGGAHESSKRWEAGEDRLLAHAVNEHGQKWRLIMPLFPGRNRQQIRCRWGRIRSGMLEAKAGRARNRCRKCGQIKRGHVCTWGLPLLDTRTREHTTGTGSSDVTTLEPSEGGDSDIEMDDGYQSPCGKDHGLVAAPPSANSDASSSRAASPCMNINDSSMLCIQDECNWQTPPNTEARQILLKFIRTSKGIRG